ncbi:MAG: site-specific integrase [Gammaproteobacteria bacterium]|nr:site-specific integrase [Gammaproteobacteria bacterium]
MDLRVVVVEGGHRLGGEGPFCDLANAYLGHLQARGFAAGTVRGYAFDLLNFGRFLVERDVSVGEVVAGDLFDWLGWQARPKRRSTGKVVVLDGRRGAAAATMNRRVAAVRGLFEYAVITGVRVDNPVPPGRRSTGLRVRPRRGMLGHLGGRRGRVDGRLVRQDRRLPESLGAEEVASFVADLETHRDRAVVLVMVLGGLRAAEVRGLLLANVGGACQPF